MKIIRTGSTIPFQNYTILDQRNFGVVSNLRKRVSDKLISGKVKELSKLQSANTKTLVSQEYNPVKIVGDRNKLYRVAKDKKVLVSPLRLNFGGVNQTTKVVKTTLTPEEANILSNSPNTKPQFYKFKRKILESKKPRSKYVVFKGGYGDEVLSHELGHIENASSLNPLKRLRYRINSSSNIREKLSNDLEKVSTGELQDRGIKNLLLRSIEDGLILGEEKSATKNALKILKKSGATKEQLSQAKNTLGFGYDTYNHSIRARRKNLLANTIYPERRKV